MKEKNWFGLENSVCFVAGANGLLGKSIVLALLDCGAKVIALDKEFSREFPKAADKAVLDLTAEKEVQNFFRKLSPPHEHQVGGLALDGADGCGGRSLRRGPRDGFRHARR